MSKPARPPEEENGSTVARVPDSEQAVSTHPTAASDLEELQDAAESLSEEAAMTARGDVALPWPHSAKTVAAFGIASTSTGAGFVVAARLLYENAGAMTLGGGVAFLAGVTLLIHAHWQYTHFETGASPRYVEEGDDGR